MAYLGELHPEIFFVIPRPGGIAKIDLPEEEVKVVGRGSKSTVKSSTRSIRSTKSARSTKSRMSKGIFDPAMLSSLTGYVCRDYRIQTTLDTSPWTLLDEYQEVVKPPNPLQDSVDILAITVTTIMLLAAGYSEVSNMHLRWTLSYLECVRDELGNCPPNVRGIMNHIKKLDSSVLSFNENLDYEHDEEKGASGEVEISQEAAIAPAPAEEAPPAPAEEAPAPAEEAPAPEEEEAPAPEEPPAEEKPEEAPAEE